MCWLSVVVIAMITGTYGLAITGMASVVGESKRSNARKISLNEKKSVLDVFNRGGRSETMLSSLSVEVPMSCIAEETYQANRNPFRS